MLIDLFYKQRNFVSSRQDYREHERHANRGHESWASGYCSRVDSSFPRRFYFPELAGTHLELSEP